MTFESTYAIGDKVAYTLPFREMRFKGRVVGVTFTESGTFYDVDIRTTIAKGVPEEQIVQEEQHE